MGQGTLIGVATGATVGLSAGAWIQSWGKKDGLLQRGDAFDFLYPRYRKNVPGLANSSLVERVLNAAPSYDKNQDGRNWYSVDDLNRIVTFLKRTGMSPQTVEFAAALQKALEDSGA